MNGRGPRDADGGPREAMQNELTRSRQLPFGLEASTRAPRPAAPLAEGLSLQGLSASRSNARRPAQARGRTRCARTAPRPRLRSFVGGLNGSPRKPCWESSSARSRLTECSGDSRLQRAKLSHARLAQPGSVLMSSDGKIGTPGRAKWIAELRRARRKGSSAKSVRVAARGMPTNGHRRGQALFEREIRASGASASSRGAGEGRRPFDRRDEMIFAGEPFRRGSRIGANTGGRPARRPYQHR